MRLATRAALALVLTTSALAGSRADPASWILWRAAPIDFPDTMLPRVPELLQGKPPIDFHPDGSELTIVMPDVVPDNHAGRALESTKRFIINKVPGASVVGSSRVSSTDLNRHLLLLGTPDQHPFVGRVLGNAAPAYLAGLRPGGYRIGTTPHPTQPHKRVILALGVDLRGAYSAGSVISHAIHPNKEGVNSLANWPVNLPAGCYWLPFEATASPPTEWEVTGPPNPAPPPPLVPIGPRIWGSPMPTAASYQRLIRALKPTGINVVVVQSGGLVDLPDAPVRFVALLDIAWQEGIYTCLYVGNEEQAHRSAPLTENHRAVILATKDHPGLLAFHLYNQLGTEGPPEQYRDLEQQVRWINSLTKKPTSIEIVWGHNAVPIPPAKQRLMRDLRSWGLDIIGTDFAPIGGWSKEPHLPRWEQKILTLLPLEPRPEVLLQAHVPFLGATVPSREQLRSQFWWALAGGTHAFYVEAAYLFTHFSMRGLVTWDLQPQTDGRYDELKRLAAHAARLAEFTRDARIATPAETAASGLTLEAASSTKLHLRLRLHPDGRRFVLVINEDLAAAAEASLILHGAPTHKATDVLAGTPLGMFSPASPITLSIEPGGAACVELISSSPNP